MCLLTLAAVVYECLLISACVQRLHDFFLREYSNFQFISVSMWKNKTIQRSPKTEIFKSCTLGALIEYYYEAEIIYNVWFMYLCTCDNILMTVFVCSHSGRSWMCWSKNRWRRVAAHPTYGHWDSWLISWPRMALRPPCLSPLLVCGQHV